MTNSTPENLPENETVEAQPPVVQAPPPVDIRRRLRDLLSIPERDRSDEQWDEIIELEIQLAPGNRISGNEQLGGGGNNGGRNISAQGQGKPGGGQQKKHRPRTNNNNNGNGNNRRPRQNKPQSGGGGGGSAPPAA